jgi:AAA family ATP:ADP antiporter
VGATAGAAMGSWLVDQMVDSGLVPTEALLLVATAPLVVSILLAQQVNKRQPREMAEMPVPKTVSDPEELQQASIWSGAKLVLVSRFLLLAALLTLFTNWVNTNGENLLFQVVQESLAEQAEGQGLVDGRELLTFVRDGTTAFYGNFYFWVNGLALLLQAFVASRLLKHGGFAAILLILPVIALASYTVMALLPILAIVKMMKVAENATDYSLNNTSRHVLWLPVSSAMKFHGKPAIDTLYVRLGDGLAAITVLIGVHMLALATQQFFVFNVFLVLCWLVAGVLLVREHRHASAATQTTG